MNISNKYNDKKIIWFPDKLRSFIDKKITAPIYIRIKPTNRCNHDCFFCVYKYSFSQMHNLSKDRESNYKGEISELSRDKLLEILDDIKSIGVKAVTYSGGGEPLVHKNIVEIMEKTLENKLDLSIITNGQLLQNEKAKILANSKWIRVSIDYTNEEEFVKSGRGNKRFFNKIFENIENFQSIKKPNCELSINFIIHKGNYNNLISITEKLKKLKVENIRFSPIWVPNFQEYHSSIKNTVIPQLKEIEFLSDNKFKIYHSYNLSSSTNSDKRNYCQCFFLQTVPVIAADYNIYACHNKAYDSSGLIGSIRDKKFSEVWFSEETRNKMLSLNPIICCKHQCANDNKNIFIHNLLSSYGDNFV